MSVFKDINQVYDCSYTRPFADDDALLNDFIDSLAHRLSWKMFEHQNEICFNISEKNPPMLKDNVIEFMRTAINNELGFVREYIICRMLISYRMSNVDLGDEAEWYLRESFDDETWAELNEALNKYVWDDYCKYLSPEKAKEYFMKINRPEFIMEGDRND